MMRKLFNIILFLLLMTGANAQEFILRGTNNQSGMEHDLGPSDTINKSTFVQLTVDTLICDTASIDRGFIDSLNTNYTNAAALIVDTLQANYIDVDTLQADNANIVYLTADTLMSVDTAHISMLSADSIYGIDLHVTDSAFVEDLVFSTMWGFWMWIDSYFFSSYSKLQYIDVDTMTCGYAYIEDANIDRLIVNDSAFIDTITTTRIYATTGTVSDSLFADTATFTKFYSTTGTISDSLFVDTATFTTFNSTTGTISDSLFADTLTTTVLTTTLTIHVPSATTTYLAAAAITVTNTLMRVAGDGAARILTSTPSIVDAVDGTEVKLQGDSEANKLTLQDESNLANSGLQLSGGQDMVLGQGDFLILIYDAGDDNWYEEDRSDN